LGNGNAGEVEFAGEEGPMAVTTVPDPKDLKWSHYTGPAPAGSPLDAFTKPRFTLGKAKPLKDGEKYRLEKVDIQLTMEKLK
jgi:hypothetical protein